MPANTPRTSAGYIAATLLIFLGALAIGQEIVGTTHAQSEPPTPTLASTPLPSAAPPAPTIPLAATPTSQPSPTLAASVTPPPATPPQPQQSAGLRLEITKTLVGSDLIQVGQYLTFTIRIRNTGAITITTLPLIDEYDPAILQPALSRFQPATSTSAAGRLDWADLTDLPGFGDLPPGGEFMVTTVFRAIGISDSVINRARVEAAVGSGGEGGAPIEGGDGGSVEGGRVVIEKSLPEQVIRADNPAVTFVITVRNEGSAALVSVPVEDLFDPAYLRFSSASPAPSRIDPTAGLLRWENIIGQLGVARLEPGQVVTATTTFTILAPIDNLVVNRIGGVDVRDEFGNAVQAPRQADVRIRIVGVADTRPTVTPPAQPRRERTATPTETETATVAVQPVMPTSAETLTPTLPEASATAAPIGATPATLPTTGGGRERSTALIWIGLICLAVAYAVRWRAT